MIPADDPVLKTQLMAHEGSRSDVYDDATGRRIVQGSTVDGHPTIGIGHNLDAAPLCNDAIDAQYRHDVGAVISEIAMAMPWTAKLDATRWRVLADLAFNAGIVGLLQFHRMLEACQKGDYLTAAMEIENSQIAPARRKRLAALMRS